MGIQDLTTHAEWAKVELRIGGVTYVYELEHTERIPLTGSIDHENHAVDMPDPFGSYVVTQPNGISTARIVLDGKVKTSRREP